MFFFILSETSCISFCTHCLFTFNWIQLKSLVTSSILVLMKYLHTLIKSWLKHLFWSLDSFSSLSHPFMTGAPILHHVCACCWSPVCLCSFWTGEPRTGSSAPDVLSVLSRSISLHLLAMLFLVQLWRLCNFIVALSPLLTWLELDVCQDSQLLFWKKREGITL